MSATKETHAPGEAALDAHRLGILRAAMGEEFSELLAVFLQTAGELLAAMRACGPTDREALHRQAHTLKASAANVGALRLSQLARGLEGCAPTAGEKELWIWIERIEDELREVARQSSAAERELDAA